MKTVLKLFPLFLLTCFCENRKSLNYEQEIKDTRIVLINTSDFNRLEIGNHIKEISKCNPAVIGILDIFDTLYNHTNDSSLAQSIKESGKVILSANISPDEDRLLHSHPLFTEAAKGQGVMSFFENEDGIVDTFVPLYQSRDEQETNFSFSLVFEFNSKKTSTIFRNFNVNEERKIRYTSGKGSFLILDPKNLSCDNIDGKIIIMGYLGPDKISMVRTPLDQDEKQGTYAVFVIANVVLNFLDEMQ